MIIIKVKTFEKKKMKLKYVAIISYTLYRVNVES